MLQAARETARAALAFLPISPLMFAALALWFYARLEDRDRS
ncbi:MAG: hypothetical protein WBO17_13950 [Sphingorhabdus sp.]